MPRLRSLLLLGLFITAGASLRAEIDGLDISEAEWKSPPTAERLAALGSAGVKDPAAVSQILLQGLAARYEPSAASRKSGSARDPAFLSWWYLARWWELLARSETAEWQRFLARYLAQPVEEVESAAGTPQLFYREPGQTFGAEVSALEEELLRELAGSESVRAQQAELFLTPDFSFRGGKLLQQTGPEFATAMAQNPNFLEEFFALLAPEDFTPAVLANLRRLWEADPGEFDQYYRLALALAVVFDQRPPPDWPHHQVDGASLLPDEQTLEERYAFWRQAQTTRRLATDLTKAGADQQRFIVDALVPASELVYARERVRIPRSQFDRAFSSIRYDDHRLQQQQFDWPADIPYTLEAIQKHGGICVDQAYFAMMAGKGQGLPTLFFVGQGADGGHAWFGFLRGEDRWNLDAGRYENQNYAVGFALDPQSWEPITDHELKFLAGRTRRSPEFRAGAVDLWWAEYFLEKEDEPSARQALAGALAVSPQNPAVWTAETELLQAAGAPFAEVRAHLEKAIRQFQGEADVRVRFQRDLMEAARVAGEEALVQSLGTALITQNRRARSDLSVTAASEKLQGLLEAGDTAGAMQEFRSQASRLGRTGGGDFFYEVVRPLAEYLFARGEDREVRRVVDTARRQLRPERGSILDQELQELSERASARR